MTTPFSNDSSSALIPSVDTVAKQLAKLPGIGHRMAQRLIFAMLKRDKKEMEDLAKALIHLAEHIKHCSVCGMYTQDDPCKLCTGESRDTSLLCVVEQAQDVLAIERTGKYNGLFHVLGGALSPIDGIGPDELGIPKLLQRLKDPVKEVILATNPTMEGDATAHYLRETIKTEGIKISRIARGLPSGSDLEYADETTLALAISSRSQL